MDAFQVGDLVRDKLNTEERTYGLGVVVGTEIGGLQGESWGRSDGPPGSDAPGKRYDVYFTKFERTITFHAEYLEKV
jgi:hypothetical protein|tara:strand:- start:308 stop:538 length:231 start_codon:yes stop_codon:yes gene_type:complete